MTNIAMQLYVSLSSIIVDHRHLVSFILFLCTFLHFSLFILFSTLKEISKPILIFYNDSHHLARLHTLLGISYS